VEDQVSHHENAGEESLRREDRTMIDANTQTRCGLLTAEPQLFVVDIEATCEFFVNKLGFSVAFRYGEPPFYAQVFRDGARLNLRHVDKPVFDPEFRDREQLLSATITLKDAESLFQQYEEAGVAFARTLRSEPWGASTFIVRDPDGNLILFAGGGEHASPGSSSG
jgi:catechol 2,3-dioxygenase-like lactoylglutathione lyase family enzyme